MGDKTKIEWCDFTFNPFIGCTRISPGCDNCYAADLALRYKWVKQWGEPGQAGDYKRTSEANWKKPLQWAKWYRKDLETFNACGPAHMVVGDDMIRRTAPRRPRVFCASLADVFDNQVPQEWRTDLFRLIASTPELDWQLLTKRPENIEGMLSDVIKDIGLSRNPPNINPQDLQLPWPNIWLGFTAEDQAHFDRRWPIIRDIPARVRFCSYEPAIGALRLTNTVGLFDSKGAPLLHWLICGGESGPDYRPMILEWEHDIRHDCAQAGVAYFQKQNAGKKPFPDGWPMVRQFPEAG